MAKHTKPRYVVAARDWLPSQARWVTVCTVTTDRPERSGFGDVAAFEVTGVTTGAQAIGTVIEYLATGEPNRFGGGQTTMTVTPLWRPEPRAAT